MSEATEEPEITTMGTKGQVVIPKSLRDHLGISPKTKFVVYGEGDIILLKRMAVPDVRKEFEEIFEAADRKRLGLTQKDVAKKVASRRRRRRRK
jgi:antitoxin PrlF